VWHGGGPSVVELQALLLHLVDGEGDGGVGHALDEDLAVVVDLDVAEVGISIVRWRGTEDVRESRRPGQAAHMTSSTAGRATPERATSSARMVEDRPRHLTRSTWKAEMPASSHAPLKSRPSSIPRMSVSRMGSSASPSGKMRLPWRRRRATWWTEVTASIIARSPPQTEAMVEEPPKEPLNSAMRDSTRVG